MIHYTELWRDIQGYEGLYQVSNYGRVRRLKRTITYADGTRHVLPARILNYFQDKYGYKRVDLLKDGTKKHYLIHRLVATAFIPNPINFPQVNHRDENPENNKLSNLEWCTIKYNNNYGNHNLREEKPIKQLSTEGKLIKVWQSAKSASKAGFSASCIYRCCNHNPWYKTHKGYRWEYV